MLITDYIRIMTLTIGSKNMLVEILQHVKLMWHFIDCKKRNLFITILIVLAITFQEVHAQNLILNDTTITTTATFSENSITAGPNFSIASTGEATLSAETVAIIPKFNLEKGGVFYVISGEQTVNVELENPVLPTVLIVHQNYPNPFNPTTTISYDLPYAANIVLKIYDILGHEIRTLLNTRQQAGLKNVVWDGRNELGLKVSSGIFIYRLIVGNFVQTKKMILLR